MYEASSRCPCLSDSAWGSWLLRSGFHSLARTMKMKKKKEEERAAAAAMKKRAVAVTAAAEE